MPPNGMKMMMGMEMEIRLLPLFLVFDGYVDNPNDCDDNDPFVNLKDLDNDGLSGCNGDCDDTNFLVNPLLSRDLRCD